MLQDVINAPPTQPLTPDEEKALGVMLRRKVHDAGTTIALPVYTGGRPRHISLTPVTGTSWEEVEAGPSVRTMTRRHDILRRLQLSMTGSEGLAQEQRVFDIQQSSRAEREQLLFRSHLATAVSPEDTMAMALHLRLTNEQQRKMRLWTKQWHLQLASERQVRKLAKDRMGDVELGTGMVQAINQEDDNT